MYLIIILLPLLGSIVSGFFGRKLGVTGSRFLSCLFIMSTTILAIISFFEIGFNYNLLFISILEWFYIEWYNLIWIFQFDSLTVAMLLNEGLIQLDNRFVSYGLYSHLVLKRDGAHNDYSIFSSELLAHFWTSTELRNSVKNTWVAQKTGRSFDFYPFYSKFKDYYPNAELPSKEFLEWFIGFAEGEGCFTVSKRSNFVFSLTQSSIDLQVLNYIKENLIFGTISLESVKKNTHRFRVQDTKNLYLICLLFNGNMVLPTRSARFLTFLTSFNEILLKKNKLLPVNPISDKVVPCKDDCWLSGFVDGAAPRGCFSISFLSGGFRELNSQLYRNGFRLTFLLTQKWEVNKYVLEHILSFFKCHGLVYCRTNKHMDIWDLKINGMQNCSALFWYFDKCNLKTKKKESYLRWKAIFYRLEKGDHLKADTRLELINLAKQINKFN